MSVWWLSRGGTEAAEGPFTEGQLRSMWAQGGLTVRDCLCLDGDQQWRPAPELMESNPPPLPEQATEEIRAVRRKLADPNANGRVILYLLGIVGLLFFLIPGIILFVVAGTLPDGGYACGNCGNTVGPAANVCPICHARLAAFWAPGPPALPKVKTPRPPSPVRRFFAWFTKAK